MSQRLTPDMYEAADMRPKPYDWQHPGLIDWQDRLLDYGIEPERVEATQHVGQTVVGGFVGHWRRPPGAPVATLVNHESAFMNFNAGNLTAP